VGYFFFGVSIKPSWLMAVLGLVLVLVLQFLMLLLIGLPELPETHFYIIGLLKIDVSGASTTFLTGLVKLQRGKTPALNHQFPPRSVCCTCST
jgi:hypothetical protein